MKWVQDISYSIKSYLSQHISTTNLRVAAFAVALFSCLVSGSILLFTLFGPSFHNVLGLSYLEINWIASLSAGGMYLCLPALGYLSDCYGPSILSFLSVWFFVPSYAFNSYLVGIGCNKLALYCGTFCLIGLATSSLYFSSLLTCAKIFPKHKGLAISLPVTCYGLSALIGSQLLKLNYFRLIYKSDGDILDLAKVFRFFAWLYAIVGVLSFVSSSIVLVEQDVIFDLDETAVDDATTPLLQDDLTPQRSSRSVDPPNHKKRFILFLRDVSAWVLLISLILNIGPMESYQNNLSSIVAILEPVDLKSNLSDKVSVLATSSTIARLVFGGLTDVLESKGYSSIPLLLTSVCCGIGGQWLNNVVLNGISYGGMFTIYPTLVASVWGIDIMGSTWGSFMVAPAMGSIIFSLFYGKVADAGQNGNDVGRLQIYFKATSFSLFVSYVLILSAYRIWRKRGQSC
ncbi:MCH1 [Candida theae]|uniref:Probable transporter MCH1 n=1 Tax=Candida theae TaxID=1198502 RepID=A0AAD5FZW8_9ASCO|nr:MCH1 [Candida theae]KAI5963408.1 MCH1 [Candida theae]